MATVRRGAAAAVLAGAFALLATPCAAAGRATNQMPVELTIPAGCEVTTRRLDFGTVAVLSFPVDATSTISLRCAPGTNYSIELDNGLHQNGAQRRMYAEPVGVAALRYVTYNLYRDAARTQVWTAQAGQVVAGIAPANGLIDVTLYGRMPFNIVMPVAYRDTVTVTGNFSSKSEAYLP